MRDDRAMITYVLSCFLILSEGVAESTSGGHFCHQNLKTLSCNVLYDVMKREGMFSIRKETLENNCTQLLDSFGCMRDYWAKCNPISFEYLIMYTSGVKEVMEELCNSGSDLRKEYESHIPCLTTAADRMKNCTHIAEKKVRILMKSSPHLHYLNINAYRCLAHIELVGCVRNVAGYQCGRDAGQLLGNLVERSVKPYRYLKCHLIEQLQRPSKKEDYKMRLF